MSRVNGSRYRRFVIGKKERLGADTYWSLVDQSQGL